MAFMGELRDIGVADLIYLLAIRRQSGKLAVTSSGDEVSLFLEHGQMVLVTSSDASLRLGRMLIRLGMIDNERLQDALQMQQSLAKGQPLGRLLLDQGVVTADDLARCVEEQCIEILTRVIVAEQGTFVYHRGAAAPANMQIVPLNSDRIVLEATRRTDELVTLRGLLPQPQAIVMLSPSIEAVAGSLSDTEVYIAATLTDGATSLAEITDRIAIDQLTLWRTLVSLRERGLILTVDDSVEATPAAQLASA